MTRRYEATFTVTVTLSVFDDNVVDRVLNNEDGWRDDLYNLNEEGVVEMLARCCGINNWPLSRLDGWADLPDSAVTTSTTIDLDGHRQISLEEEHTP